MLRSFLAFGLVLSILAAGAPPAQAQQRPDWIGQGLPQTLVVCTATGTTANLRSGTDTDSPVEARLQNGAHVVVMREMQFPDRWSWFHVRHVVPGRPELRPEGWMHGSLIQRNCSMPHDAVAAGSRGSVVGGLDLGPPPRGLRAAAPVSLIPVEVCVQTGDTLNLRSGPGTGSPVLASLENGTPLVILTGDAEATGPWLRVRLGDPAQVFHLGRQVEGYVFNRYVLDDYCQTQHNPLVAGTRGSRLGGRDVTLGAWASDHDMHVWNPSHPQSRRVLGVGLPAHRAYLADLGISEDPYPEDTAAIAAQASAAPNPGQPSPGQSATGTRTATDSPPVTPAAATPGTGTRAAPGPAARGPDMAAFRDVARTGRAPFPIYSVALSPDNTRLVLGLTDSTTRLYDVASLQQIEAFNLEGQETQFGTAVTVTVFSPDGQMFAAAEPWKRYDYANPYSHLRIRDRGGRLIRSMRVNEPMRGAQGLAFSPDSRLIAAATGAGTAMLWEISSGRLLWETVVSEGADPGRFATSAAFAPDGRSLFIGIHAGAVLELEAASGRELRRYPTRQGALSRVFLSPDGTTIGVSNVAGDTLVIDRASGAVRYTIYSGSANSAFFSPDGRYVVGIGAEPRRPIGYFPLTGHQDRFHMREDFHRPSTLAASPQRTVGAMASDGSFLVLGDMNGDILIVRPRP